MVATADALAGSTVIIFLPLALMTAVHWRSLSLARRASLESPVDLRAGDRDGGGTEAPDEVEVSAGG